MAKKENSNIPLRSDKGSDFEDEDDILNFRPNISFVAPDHEIEFLESEIPEEEPTAEDIRDRTRAAVTGLDELYKLANNADKRIDARIKSLGGLTITFDPVRDQAVIAAMKRVFPNKTNYLQMTYEDYKTCLNDLESEAQSKTDNSETQFIEGFLEAKTNPLKTNFGGLGELPGTQRPEVVDNGSGAGIAPLDLVAFQASAVVGLFNMMSGLITDLVLSLLP